VRYEKEISEKIFTFAQNGLFSLHTGEEKRWKWRGWAIMKRGCETTGRRTMLV